MSRRSIGARLGACTSLFAVLCCLPLPVGRTLRAEASAGPQHVPVLMYHFIRNNPVPGDVLGFHLSVTPDNFAQQIALLSMAGHHAVSLEAVMAAMDSGTPLPPNPVVLTFDDGYDNFASLATPMLHSLGMTGTDYVVPGFTGTPGYMSVEQIRWVVHNGMTIGAHTMHHRDLATMDDGTARSEIQGSRDVLRAWTGTGVATFAYPYGSFNARTPGIVASAGFSAALSTRAGADQTPGDRFTLPRVRVDGADDLASFGGKLGIGVPGRGDVRFWSKLEATAAAARHGSIVGVAATRSGGYLLTGRSGSVRAFGPAVDAGSITGQLAEPVVGLSANPVGSGYWLVASDGGIFPFGDAGGYGSTGALRLNKPMVGMASTWDGHGYWLVASDGGIFPFGEAGGYGSLGGVRLNQPVVGIAATPTGRGYWVVARDGGVFPFGDAGGYGSTGGIRLNQPIVGVASTADGRGYWLVAADGGVFPFGDAGGYGSTGNIRLNSPIVSVAASPSGRGYWLVAADGGVFPFGDAVGYGSAVEPGPSAPGVTLG